MKNIIRLQKRLAIMVLAFMLLIIPINSFAEETTKSKKPESKIKVIGHNFHDDTYQGPILSPMTTTPNPSLDLLKEEVIIDLTKNPEARFKESKGVIRQKVVGTTMESVRTRLLLPTIYSTYNMDYHLENKSFAISANGQTVPYKLRVGPVVDDALLKKLEGGKVSFDDLKNRILPEQYIPKNYKPTDKIFVYNIKFTAKDQEETRLDVFGDKDSLFFVSGNGNIIPRDGDGKYGTMLVANEQNKGNYMLFSHGKAPEKLTIDGKVLEPGNNSIILANGKTFDYTMDVFQTDLVTLFSRNDSNRVFNDISMGKIPAFLNKELVENMLFEKLDQIYGEKGKMVAIEDLLVTTFYDKRLFFLDYDMVVKGKEEITGEINIPVITKHSQVESIIEEEVNYVGNTDNRWNSIKNFTLIVKADTQSPYITNSTVTFKNNNGVYVYTDTKIPEKMINVQLSSSQPILTMRQYMTIIGALAVLVTSLVIIKRKKRKNRRR